jgi:putative ABC transport system permease protein
VHIFLFGMNDWHLHNDFENGKKTNRGRIEYVHLFSVIAWIILVIACINFMNLATASSEKRSKEVGVRKVLGAAKKTLIFQFIGEAIIMAVFAAFAAGIIMSFLLHAFNQLVQKNLFLGMDNPVHLLALFLLTLICGLLAGSYPSLYLSSFNPVFVLKGIRIKTGGAAIIRKGLVVAQFSVSIVLIIGTIIIYQQIQHVKSRDLGYNKDNLIEMNAYGDMVKNFPVIRQDLIKTDVVENAALADHETISDGNNTSAIEWPGKNPSSIFVISQRLVSPEFMATAGMHMEEGRDFEPSDLVEFRKNQMPKDSNQAFNVIITKSLEKLLGKGTAIGKLMKRQTDRGVFHMLVTGVIGDYVYGDMYGQSAPVIFYDIPQAASLMYLRIKTQASPENALAKIEAVLKKDNQGYPFEFRFVDDQFNEKFLSEMLINKLSRVFASLAILISCLGLFGLVAYTAERRTKEIGVRKVLGASVTRIAALISTDFIKLVGISCIVAFPVAWWIMHNWLQNYQYRIEISWWIFPVAAVLAICIALVTVSFQAIKAAIANPVNSLRNE